MGGAKEKRGLREGGGARGSRVGKGEVGGAWAADQGQ